MNTLEEAFQAYLEYAQVMNFTHRTLENKAEHFKRFQEWTETRSITLIEEVTKDTLFAYQKFLHRWRKPDGEPLAPSTQEVYTTSIKVLFNWLMQEGHIQTSPALGMQVPKQPKKLISRGLSHDELKQLFESCDSNSVLGIRNRCLLELMYCTAARRAEVAQFQLKNIDHEKRTIFIELGKGQKDGIVLFGKSAAHWLERYLTHSRPMLEKASSPKRQPLHQRVPPPRSNEHNETLPWSRCETPEKTV